jgi:hypothetical protein
MSVMRIAEIYSAIAGYEALAMLVRLCDAKRDYSVS